MLQNVAPHLCCGCGKIGHFLCEECKNDIISEPFLDCIWCRAVHSSVSCDIYSWVKGVWIVGKRHTVLKQAINSYKFRYVKYGSKALSELLANCLPLLPPDTIVTSIPTLPTHIRARGYDHAALLARRVAYITGLQYRPLLQRTKAGTQHTASRRERTLQAHNAYVIKPRYQDLNVPVLLIDDVVTTGATLKNAAKALRSATEVLFIAALAYQPLDE